MAEVVGMPARRMISRLFVEVFFIALDVIVSNSCYVFGGHPMSGGIFREAPGMAFLAAPVASGLIDGKILLRCFVSV